MSASWAGVAITALMLAATLIVWVWRDGQRQGRQDVILDRLTSIAEDHEDRIRTIERHRPRHRVKTPGTPPH